MIRCDVCGGKGEYMGLGLISHKCKKCAGTGWLLGDGEEVKKSLDNPQLTVDTVVDNKKKSDRSERMKAAWAKRKARNADNK